MKVIEQYFCVVLFIVLYKVVQSNFKSVDETLLCDHSYESYWTVLFPVSCGMKFFLFNLWSPLIGFNLLLFALHWPCLWDYKIVLSCFFFLMNEISCMFYLLTSKVYLFWVLLYLFIRCRALFIVLWTIYIFVYELVFKSYYYV